MAVPDRWAASARRLFAELGESRLEAVKNGSTVNVQQMKLADWEDFKHD